MRANIFSFCFVFHFSSVFSCVCTLWLLTVYFILHLVFYEFKHTFAWVFETLIWKPFSTKTIKTPTARTYTHTYITNPICIQCEVQSPNQNKKMSLVLCHFMSINRTDCAVNTQYGKNRATELKPQNEKKKPITIAIDWCAQIALKMMIIVVSMVPSFFFYVSRFMNFGGSWLMTWCFRAILCLQKKANAHHINCVTHIEIKEQQLYKKKAIFADKESAT